jgi:diguanylate cyclase (GGDEF)-like protein/PAS domain S-box-containing protein
MSNLDDIIAAAEKLADGDLQARTGVVDDGSDTGRLAAAIDNLAESFQAHRRHIEQLTRQHRRSLRAHHILSASNRALLRSTEEAAELHEVTRLIVEVGNYPFTWIGYAEQDETQTIRPMAHYGMAGDHLYEMKLTWADRDTGQGVAGTAIRSGKPLIIRDAPNDPRMAPWHAHARKHGLSSVLGLPLYFNSHVSGVLVVWAVEPDAFDKEEIKLLTETVDDLTFSIETVRARVHQRQVEEAFRHVSHQKALILEAAAEGIYVVDPPGTINFVNPAANTMLGYAPNELLGRNAHDAVHHSMPNGDPYPRESCPISTAIAVGTTVQRVQDTFWRKDGAPVQVEVSSTPIFEDGELKGAVVMVTDISERARYMAQIERKSNFDELTGLPNRNLLNDRLEQALDRCRQEKTMLAILVINLNHFRNIIDSLGHTTGDLVLQAVAQTLYALEGETDTLARAGGDEFVWAIEVDHEEHAAVAAREALEALAQPLNIGEREVFLSASIGIGIFPRDGEDTDTVLKNATTAMHRAKKMDDHRFSFYATEMNARSLERLDLENALRRALENDDELMLYYQPQLSLHTGEIYGAEALLRWQHPQRGMVSPAEFIPIAEASGIIVPLGEWVLRTACRQNKAWQNAGLRDICVAVNMSARQLDAQDIAGLAAKVLQEFGLDPSHLELELTESMIMSDPDAFIGATRKLKDTGIFLSVDDFGTGYSSLNYLKRFSIDRLKIDQSFVRDITHDPNAAAITMAIIALAKSLKMSTIAEGVETAAQLNFLKTRGCDEMQGYYFSRPVPADEFALLLQEQRKLVFPETHHKPQNTILLVDDEPSILSALKRLLRREGYTILTAENGMEGLNLLAGNEVGLVISDARMTPTNGPDFLAKVREMYPDTIRIILSGYTDLQAITEAVNKGEIYKFLTKPWEDEKLLKTIHAAFRHHEEQRRKGTS